MRPSEKARVVIHPDVKTLFLLAVCLPLLASGVTLAQGISKTFDGLHGGADVNGVSASSVTDTYTNYLPIALWAFGETDPTLYTDLTFAAVGIDVNDVNLVNSAAIDVNAVGGVGETNSAFVDASVGAGGIDSRFDVNNTGDIDVAVTAGTGAGTAVNAIVQGVGIYAYDVNNAGAITVMSQGGTADANTGDAASFVFADGLYSNPGDINNVGDVVVAAIGGHASGQEDAEAYAVATGLNSSGVVANGGAIDVDAHGGTAISMGDGDPDASATAYGIDAEDAVTNGGAIDVNATGGTAEVDDDAVASAWARAYGIHSDEGLIANSGQVDVMALGGTASSGGIASGFSMDTSASSYAYGLYSAEGSIESSAAVNVSAAGGDVEGTATDVQHEAFASARAYGLYLEREAGMSIPGRYISNSGDVTVEATGGTGEGALDEIVTSARGYGIIIEEGDMVNSGRVTVEASGGDALCDSNDTESEPGAGALAYAYGLQVDLGDVDNSGAVTVTATGGEAAGQGTAEASAQAQATGIVVSGDEDASFMAEARNTAAVTVMAVGGTATSSVEDADAYAIAEGFTAIDANVFNTGAITVTAQGGTATGAEQVDVHAVAYGLQGFGGDLSNSGDVTVTAHAGTGTGAEEGVSYAMAYGVWGGDETFSNTGDVTVTAIGEVADTTAALVLADAAGLVIHSGEGYNTGDITVAAEVNDLPADYTGSASVSAYGIRSYSLHNSGDITVTATTGDGVTSSAYGIEIFGTSTLTNTGTIRVAGNEAYELFISSGTTTLVDTYNVTLDGDDPNDASICVDDGATLALNDSTLTVTGIVGETIWDTEYQLFETVGTGAVDGNFVAVEAVNPDMGVTYYDQNSVDSSDDTVSLSYTPPASEAAASAAVGQQLVSRSITAVNQHMTHTMMQGLLSLGTSGALADAGSTARSLALAESDDSATSGLFVEPYYAKLDHDANPMGYDAKLWGFAAGYERQMDDTLISLHVGYGQADVDYTGTGYSANSEDQDIVTAGVSGLTRWDDWTLRYGLTGFYGSHDYQGLTGTGLSETEEGETHSYGLTASLMAGHVFQRGSHILLPEVGVNWLWGHRQRYTTEASDPAWDTTYSAMDDHDLQAEASLNWLCGFMHNDIHVIPSASVGVRRLLTDGESSVSQSVPGAAPVTVDSERDRTALALTGAVVLRKTRHTISVAYDGEFSPDAERHSAWLRYAWQF